MEKIINYEKSILFKTKIDEITNISVEEDFSNIDNKIEGNFIIKGEYKSNKLNVKGEDFLYKLPLIYEYDKNKIDKDSIKLTIDNFDYNIANDELDISIDLKVCYEELENEVIFDENLETRSYEEVDFEDINYDKEFDNISNSIDDINTDRLDNMDELNDNNKNEEDKVNDEYVKYYVHIIRETDTLDKIANLYNVSIDTIKEYNIVDSINVKDKLIIPVINE